LFDSCVNVRMMLFVFELFKQEADQTAAKHKLKPPASLAALVNDAYRMETPHIPQVRAPILIHLYVLTAIDRFTPRAGDIPCPCSVAQG
jgi:hypothetical protein